MKPPADLTRILSSHLRSAGTVEALFNCGVRWEETDPEKKIETTLSAMLKTAHDSRRQAGLDGWRRRLVRTPARQHAVRAPTRRVYGRLTLEDFRRPPHRRECGGSYSGSPQAATRGCT